MGNLFNKITDKRFIAGLTAILFVFHIAMPSFSLSAYAEEKPGETATETNISAKSASEKKVKELTRYLNAIGSEAGRADFKKHLDEITFKNDRFAKLRENLAYHTAMEFGIKTKASSLIKPDFISLAPLNKEISPKKSTYGDLILRMEREMNLGKLILRTIDSADRVNGFLRDDKNLANIDKLKEKLALAEKLIEVLEKKTDADSYALLAELKLEKRITDFKIAYVATALKLLTMLTEYIGADLASLKDKTEKEEALLLLIEQLNEKDDWESKELDPFSYNLLESYLKRDVDTNIIKNINILIHLGTILKYFDTDSFEKYSTDISLDIENLNEIFGYIDKQDNKQFNKSAELFYKFLANKNQGHISYDWHYGSYYVILKTFDSLLNIVSPENFENEINELNIIHPFVVSAKEEFEKKLKEPIEDPIGDPIVDPVVGPIVDTKSVTETVKTEISNEPAAQVKTKDAAEISNIEKPVITETSQNSDKKDELTSVGDGHVRPHDEQTDIAPVATPDTKTDTEEKKETNKTENLIDTAREAIITKIKESVDTVADVLSESKDKKAEDKVMPKEGDEETKNIASADEKKGEDKKPDENLPKEKVVPEETITQDTVQTLQTAETEKIDDKLSDTSSAQADTNKTDEKNVGTSHGLSMDEQTEIAPPDTATRMTENTGQNPDTETGKTDATPANSSPKTPEIEKTDEEPLSPEIANIIWLFKGEENIFEKVIEATRIIAKDQDILYTDEAINKFQKIQKTSSMAEKIFNDFQEKSQSDDIKKIVDKLGIADEELDEVISLFNQFAVNAGYIDEKMEFSGLNGVIKFGAEKCPDLKSELTDRNINFCVSSSSDISAKNLIGYSDYTQEITDKYVINQKDIKADWNNAARSAKIIMAGGRYFAITGLNGAYTMSALHNPDELFTSAEGKDEFEEIVIHESDDHVKNVIDIFKKDAHLITPKSLERYIIYNYGGGEEKEEIKFENAVLYDKNGESIEGYITDTAIKSNPDFIISKPIVLDKDNNQVELSYSISEDKKSLIIEVKPGKENYPAALNLELTITAEGQNRFNHVIDSESGAVNKFASAQTVGDFNGDLYDDLAIGSYAANNNSGRVDIYYYNAVSKSFDDKPNVTLKGEVSGYFGYSLASGDINGDSVADLIVGSPMNNKKTGKVEIFYGGKSFINPDAIIKGAGEGDEFGTSLLVSDLNDDGKTDLAISAPADLGGQGIVHIFYNKSLTASKEIMASASDIEIAGENQNNSRFGEKLTAGDFDNDKNTDIAISAPFYKLPGAEIRGRVYLFMQDKTPWTNQKSTCGKNCKADNADTVLEGGINFGKSLAAGDLNGDKKHDLAIGKSGSEGSNKDGGISIFYQNKEKWISPDTQISGKSDEQLGLSLLLADFNNDGISDLVSGAKNSVYIFYGKKESAEFAKFTESKDANVRWDGEYNGDFGYSLTAGAFNGDNIADLVIGDPIYQNSKGRSYVFYGNSVGDGHVRHQDELTETKPVDTTIPQNPVIACTGFVSVVMQSPAETKCTWDDTAGPSKGIYKYCVDIENKCAPDKENPERSVEIKEFAGHHNYLRVQTKDEGGESEIVSFDLTINSLPEIGKNPSDGGSDQAKPTEENNEVIFSITAKDVDNDKYNLIVCDSDEVILNEGANDHSRLSVNNKCTQKTYCTSELTESGKEAKCSYKPENGTATSYDWYAFVCETIEGKTYCSKADQGMGAEGSPFYIKRPPKYGKVQVTNMSGGEIELGDRIKVTLDSKEIFNIPAENNVRLFVCSSESTGFDYEKDECIGGSLICSSEPTDSTKNNIICDERLTNPTHKIPAKSGIKNINVYAEYGEKGVIEGDHKRSYEVKNISPVLINYINQGDINIPAGGSLDVSFSANIKDLNGWDDIKSAEGVFFDSDKVSNECGENNNNCYIDQQCDLIKVDDMSARAECRVKVFYNANAGKNWKVHIKPTDAGGGVMDFISSNMTREVPKLIAINQERISIPYKETNPGAVSEAIEVILTNLGNQQVDVLIEGTDLIGKNSSIKKELQKWSTDPKFDYEKQGYSLVETATSSAGSDQGCANVTLPVSDNKTSLNMPIYWKIFIPKNIKSDLYEGSVTFEPTKDGCK